jgi:UPF0755 protein
MRSSERPRIAAVYLNRPAPPHAAAGRPDRAVRARRPPGPHLLLGPRVQSPYNTYLNVGLPPGPIGNPGRASIEAVLNPTPGSRELFFVARGDGSHIFSETGEQHLAAVARIRALRAAGDSLAVIPLDPGLAPPVEGTAPITGTLPGVVAGHDSTQEKP